MKGKRIFIKSSPEVQQAIKLNLPNSPKLEFEEIEFFFHLHNVIEMYITADGYISILLQGREVLLKMEKRVYEKIKLHFE